MHLGVTVHARGLTESHMHMHVLHMDMDIHMAIFMLLCLLTWACAHFCLPSCRQCGRDSRPLHLDDDLRVHI